MRGTKRRSFRGVGRGILMMIGRGREKGTGFGIGGGRVARRGVGVGGSLIRIGLVTYLSRSWLFIVTRRCRKIYSATRIINVFQFYDNLQIWQVFTSRRLLCLQRICPFPSLLKLDNSPYSNYLPLLYLGFIQLIISLYIILIYISPHNRC